MNKISKVLVNCIILILAISCRSEGDLGDGYYYIPPFDVIDNGFPYGSLIYKSDQINSYSNFIVWSEIVAIKNTDHYLLVKQNPNYDKFKNCLEDMSESTPETRKGYHIWCSFLPKKDLMKIEKLINQKKRPFLDHQMDSVLYAIPSVNQYFQNDTNYFVVDKIKNTVTNPLNHEQFIKMLHNNNISDTL